MIEHGDIVIVYDEVDFSDLTDIHGERVDGIPTEGWGRLLIWDLCPLSEWGHPCVWVAIRPPEGEPVSAIVREPADDVIYTVVHEWPPKERDV